MTGIFDLLVPVAQACPAPASGGEGLLGGLGGGMMIPMLIIFGIFYFMLIRPQQRKEKERKKMITELKTGARVMFGGGMLGVIANVKEHTFMIKIADGVKVEVSRGAVSRVLEKGEKATDEDK
ncbi:MAG: preprotein translocase subunit YajC [Kiritimatiellae bacterium]|nr:preprotein translocase subunit YajC [Kiritimatiellia bacterium]